MALITGLGLFVASVLTAALSRILAAEARAWNPSVIRRIIKFAAARLPENQRDRFAEEWQSHVNDVPGDVAKFFVAAGFVIAAYNVSLSDRHNQALLDGLAVLEEMQSTSTTVLRLIQDDETLTSLEGMSTHLSSLRSCLREVQEQRNQLATRIATDSATPQAFIANLSYALINRFLRKTIRDQTPQLLERMRKARARIVKVAEERSSRRGL